MADRKILVIKRERAFEILGGYFQGFQRINSSNVIAELERDAFWMEKKLAEENPRFKQLIGYTAIIYPSDRSVFAYRRSVKDSDYEEKRLQGKWSWGVGGHVEKCDSNFPIISSVLREIEEEVEIGIGDHHEIELLGFINDDSNSVGEVHIGLLFVCKIRSPEITAKDSEIAFGCLKRIPELLQISREEEVENWSIIILPFLKEKMGMA